MVIEELARITRIKAGTSKYRGRTGSGRFKGEPLFFLKPGTYMNLSGESVRACLRALKLAPDSLIVIHDDLDLAPGRVRVKRGGGPGGHKGVASIIENLGSADFVRVKLGIGKPDPGEDPADYVLATMSDEETELMKTAVEKAAQAVLAVVFTGVEAAMNKVNARAEKNNGKSS